MLNQHDDHSSFNPANYEYVSTPCYEDVLASLSNEQQEVIEEHILDLVAQAKRPLKRLKALQEEIDKLQAEKDALSISTFGIKGTENNPEYYKVYNLLMKKENELRETILTTK